MPGPKRERRPLQQKLVLLRPTQKPVGTQGGRACTCALRQPFHQQNFGVPRSYRQRTVIRRKREFRGHVTANGSLFFAALYIDQMKDFVDVTSEHDLAIGGKCDRTQSTS